MHFSIKDEGKVWFAVQWRRMATDNDCNHAKLFNASFVSIIAKKVIFQQIIIITDTYD